VSKVSPEVVVRAVEEIDRVNPRTIPLCGAGIVDPADVTESIRLGARGVLVSSSIVKNMNRYEKIYDLCRALTV
jgi:tryptophan synthase alpha subunit